MRSTCVVVLSSTLLVVAMAATAGAETTEDGAEIEGTESINPDPYELQRLRLDGGLGGTWGDGDGTFAMRVHVGASKWIRPNDSANALRLTGGLALGADIADSQHSYATAAPFVELGLAYVDPRLGMRAARNVTVFGRVEPVLAEGTLHEHAMRVGVGVTLHGFSPFLLKSDGSDGDDARQLFVYTVGLPIIAALNVRHVEVVTDVGIDGHKQIGFLLGMWGS
jgi:hypothetical protein